MLNKIKKLRGFTLIELIIVIAIIAILAAIAVPAFGQIRQKANVSSDLGNARTIYSLVATELASGNIDDNITDITVLGDIELLDGTEFDTKIEPTPVVKTYQKASFAITITDGNVQVYALDGDAADDGAAENDAVKIYPEASGKYGSN